MEDIFDNLKTASLISALEPLSVQILELENLTPDIICQCQNLDTMLDILCGSVSESLEGLLFTLKNQKPQQEIKERINELSKETSQLIAEIEYYSAELKTGDLALLDEFKNKCASFLEIAVKILLVWDSIKLERLLESVQQMQKLLNGLYKTPLLDEIVFIYREFVSQLLETSPKIRSRVNDLIQQDVQHEIIITLQNMSNWSRLFAPALKSIAKNPISRHSRASKDFVVKELQLQLTEMERLLTLPSTVTLSESATYTSSFITAVDFVLGKLEGGEMEEFSELETNLLFILRHAMTVGKFSHELDKEKITKTSENVLAEFRSLQKCLEEVESSQANLDLMFDIVVDFVELLEQQVNHSLLRMMIENLSTATEPLNRLIGSSISKTDQSAGTEKNSSQLDPEISVFDESIEKILQTGFFALASTSDFQQILSIRCALSLLESTESEIVPAACNCYTNPTDSSAQGHLKFLWKIFHENCGILQRSLDSIADPAAFCHVAETVITTEVKQLQKLEISVLEALDCGKKIHKILKRCWDIIATQTLDDGIKGKLPLPKLQLAMAELQGSFSRVKEDAEAVKSLLKRTEIALKYLGEVNDNLKEMQDSQYTERNNSEQSEKSIRTVLDFPTSVHGLPVDVSEAAGTGRRLGRKTPRRALNQTAARTEVPRSARNTTGFLEQLGENGQPWRNRTQLFHSTRSNEVSGETEKTVSETFDLSALLEDITAIDNTLTSATASSSGTSQSEIATPYNGLTTVVTPLSISIGTPQRINDLHKVMERLEQLRKLKTQV